MKQDYVISIDFGGTKILSAIINSSEGIVARVKKATMTTDTKKNLPLLITQSINELIMQTSIPESSIKAVCIGAPGSVDPRTGIIGLAPNLGLKHYNLKDEMQKYTNIPVLVENDVNLAALGIHGFGEAKGLSNVLVVFVGTGIGGGLILNGKIYRGASFIAGEIGHIHIMDNGPICGCGKKGCFEAVASRTAIVRDLSKSIRLGKASRLAKLVKTKTRIKSKSLLDALIAGDSLTVKQVAKASETIGKTLAGVNNLLNLDMIILGGGVIEAMKKYTMPTIKQSFKDFSFRDSAKTTKIIATKIADESALWGGIELAREFLDIEV